MYRFEKTYWVNANDLQVIVPGANGKNQNAQQHVVPKLLEHEVEKLSQKRKTEESVAEKVEK